MESYYKAEEKNFYALLSPTTQDDAATFLTVTVKADDAPDTDPGTKLIVKGIPTLAVSNSYTYTLTVGKNMIAVSSVTVKAWNDGGSVIENGGKGEAEEKTDGPDTSTNTIKTSKAGQINSNPTWIEKAINGGTSLAVTGPMDDADITAIANYLKANDEPVISLDLSEAEITSIAEQAFYGLKVENTSIDYRAKSLGEVKLPKGLTEIGRMAFSNCPAFTIANWDELTSLTTLGGSAFMNSGLKGDIILPESITTIGTLAFSEAAITSIVFPSGITTIGQQMFYRCYSLKKVVFKGNVKSLEGSVFGACSALEEIDLSACTTVPTYTSNPFADLLDSEAGKITLKVKAGLVESFNGDENWKKCNVTAVE